MRRDIERDEKGEWITETRGLLQQQGKKGTQKQIADALGMSESWVKKYDPKRTRQEQKGVGFPTPFYGYNIWGFRDESWREL